MVPDQVWRTGPYHRVWTSGRITAEGWALDAGELSMPPRQQQASLDESHALVQYDDASHAVDEVPGQSVTHLPVGPDSRPG
jgi:hypothetical protein